MSSNHRTGSSYHRFEENNYRNVEHSPSQGLLDRQEAKLGSKLDNLERFLTRFDERLNKIEINSQGISQKVDEFNHSNFNNQRSNNVHNVPVNESNNSEIEDKLRIMEENMFTMKNEYTRKIFSLETQVKDFSRDKISDSKLNSQRDEEFAFAQTRMNSLEQRIDQLEELFQQINYRLENKERSPGRQIESKPDIQTLSEIKKLNEVVQQCLDNQMRIEQDHYKFLQLRQSKAENIGSNSKSNLTPTKRTKSSKLLTEIPSNKPSSASKVIQNSNSNHQNANLNNSFTSPDKKYYNIRNKPLGGGANKQSFVVNGSHEKSAERLDSAPDYSSLAQKKKIYEDIENLKRMVKLEKDRSRSALKDEVKKSARTNVRNHTPHSRSQSRERRRENSDMFRSSDKFMNQPGGELDAARQKIDYEIQRRLEEQNSLSNIDPRVKMEVYAGHDRKAAEKSFTMDDEFKITPLSTEKSRDKEVSARLSLEKKLRNELIDRYSSAMQKNTKSPKRAPTPNEKSQRQVRRPLFH